MAKKASSEELRAALEEHLSVTEGQVARMEQVFEALGKPAKAKTCKAMQGLIEEASEIMEEDATDSVLDAGIIGAAHIWAYFNNDRDGYAIKNAAQLKFWQRQST